MFARKLTSLADRLSKMASTDNDELTGDDIFEDSRAKLGDLDLFVGTCKMPGYSVPIMIRKGPEIKKTCYNIMRNFHHQTSIRHLNFYPEGNMGRLVIPVVKASFDKWIRKDRQGQRLLFAEHGTISILFKTMIADLCDVVEKLYGNGIMIKNLHWNNLYLAAEDAPRLLLLVTEAEHVLKEVNKIELWKPVTDIIEWCCDECQVQLNYGAKRYVGFIKTKKFTVRSLKKYPDNWEYETKGDYLVLAMAKQHSAIRSSITHKLTDIRWPLENGRRPSVLDLIIKHQSDRNTKYSDLIDFDYVRLIRDTYKHFDKLPQHIRNVFVSQEGFLKKVEQWSPTIWVDLYDVTGWP